MNLSHMSMNITSHQVKALIYFQFSLVKGTNKVVERRLFGIYLKIPLFF